jgi:phosphoglucosamine mutase
VARRLFGTDGVRGVAGELVTPELALGLGRAVVERARERDGGADGGRPRLLVIRDTRESGAALEAALAAGVAAAGGEALFGGVLPTPAAPILLGRLGLEGAAVISASHNPYADNGLKFFGPDGFKLSDEAEDEVEQRLAAGPAGAPAGGFGRTRSLHGALEDYLRALHERFAGLDLSGRRILLDCAHGATYRAAPEIFRRLGAEVTVVANRPDGRNINDACGSTAIASLPERADVAAHDAAFAFDGDGDRVLAMDSTGAEVDGDELIALAALHLRASGRLTGDGVAVTVMTNYGFHSAMEAAGIEVATTPVGDRHVLAELARRGWALGGEQSGHIIDLGFAASGDGIAAALLTLEALAGGDLAARHAMEKLPQTLVNVRVEDRDAYARDPAVARAVEEAAEALEGRGRVLVRPSGTEPLVRVMVEAPTAEEARVVCDRLVLAVQGAPATSRAATIDLSS